MSNPTDEVLAIETLRRAAKEFLVNVRPPENLTRVIVYRERGHLLVTIVMLYYLSHRYLSSVIIEVDSSPPTGWQVRYSVNGRTCFSVDQALLYLEMDSI